MRIGPPNLANITKISLDHLIARLQGKDSNYDPKVPDFLQHFIESKETHPELVNDGVIMGYLLVNLLAGADTTAITIRAIFWYALHNREAYKKLEAEILAADLADIASFSSARALPCELPFRGHLSTSNAADKRSTDFEAVVREAMRMHPGVCMLLERYVPDSGLKLPDGRYIPAGTAVGINPYVVGRNKGIWGDDADTYRPERWLQNEDETDIGYKERLRLYNASDLTFGGGSRICIGRNLAQLEVYKIVATLIRRYDISLVDADQPWEVTGSWFPRQKGLKCYLKLLTIDDISSRLLHARSKSSLCHCASPLGGLAQRTKCNRERSHSNRLMRGSMLAKEYQAEQCHAMLLKQDRMHCHHQLAPPLPPRKPAKESP
ncbi:benzoate 4-monooxygenase cytochrome p450 [Ilyonectria robusta]